MNAAPLPSRLAFVASERPEAQAALQRLTRLYGAIAAEEAEVIVALGGDGFMLETLHSVLGRGAPVFGMNRGSVGFLMNDYAEDDLPARIAAADPTRIHPLQMDAVTQAGDHHSALAINEVSLLRQTRQSAKLRITVDARVRMEELSCDGCLIATPAGSTAYNLSVQGPIIPIEAPLLALTPISPFRPRRWHGALLSDRARVAVEVIDPGKRPVAAVADHAEVRNIAAVEIAMDHTISLHMLFDPGHSLDERILREQFDA